MGQKGTKLVYASWHSCIIAVKRCLFDVNLISLLSQDAPVAPRTRVQAQAQAETPYCLHIQRCKAGQNSPCLRCTFQLALSVMGLTQRYCCGLHSFHCWKACGHSGLVCSSSTELTQTLTHSQIYPYTAFSFFQFMGDPLTHLCCVFLCGWHTLMYECTFVHLLPNKLCS